MTTIIRLVQLYILTQIMISIVSSDCQICIDRTVCTDDTIFFSIFISDQCQSPLATRFSLGTDVTSSLTYFNLTISCCDCQTNVSIDAVKDAWDYTLRLESPIYEKSKNCSTTQVARCGGSTSKIVVYSAAGLSALFILFGASVCLLRHYRKRRLETTEKTRIEQAVIN